MDTGTDAPSAPCPPVLMILFNRPHLAARVLEQVRRARPARLYLAVDGGRDATARPDDARLTRECRELAAQVDWPCEVATRFSEVNQGCGRGPSNAISWFFSREAAGIVLEDDCVPGPTFFRYCAEMLARHADDPRVMHVNGNNFAPAMARRIYGGHSYGFTRYAQAWGWASWARAWRAFDYEVAGIAAEDPAVFHAAGIDRLRQAAHHQRVISVLGRHRHDVWDYQWQYAVMKSGGLCVSPAVNQITNVGDGADATHTGAQATSAAAGKLVFPLVHPPVVAESAAINRVYADHMLGGPWRYRKKALKRWLRGLAGIRRDQDHRAK
jgi:hypothetical protein